MGGNTLCLPSGLAMDSPSRTLVLTSSTALEMTWLFTVSFTISSAWRIGTPARINMLSVEEKRARATLWNRGPNTGTRTLIASMRARPESDFLYRLNRNVAPTDARMTIHQYFVNTRDTV